MMPYHAYLFEAKSIQTYIFNSNRLREIVGASELLEVLCQQPLDSLLRVLGVNEHERQFSRRAGGAFFVYSQHGEHIEKLATLWPLMVETHAPGLDFVHATGRGDTAYQAHEQARSLLNGYRNTRPPQLPLAGPWVIRNRRTGTPANFFDRRQDEAIDLSLKRKLKHAGGLALLQRFHPDPALKWPSMLSREPGHDAGEQCFPYQGSREGLALIHADGNGLGQLLIDLGEILKSADFIRHFKAFSDAIVAATGQAAQRACDEVLLVHAQDRLMPARPIVLGGDDMTILVRADLALDFTASFIRHFEQTTAEGLAQVYAGMRADGLALPDSLPDSLSACAGIVYIKASQPFYQVVQLAELLCKQAKGQVKEARNLQGAYPVSAIAFHRITTSQIPDNKTALDAERLCMVGNDTYRQGLPAYTLRQHPHLPGLDDLRALLELFEQDVFSRGPLRQLVGLLPQDMGATKKRYARWRGLRETDLPSELARFDRLLESLLKGRAEDALPYRHCDGVYQSPVADALMLQAINKNSHWDSAP